MKDNYPVRVTGRLHLKVYKNGELIEEDHGQNLVVDLGRDVMADLLGGLVAREIDTIGVGTDGTPPAAGDTLLTNPFTKSIDSAVNNGDYSITFFWTLLETEANSLPGDIEEYGLITKDVTLFARKVRNPITKDPTVRLEGRWIIQF